MKEHPKHRIEAIVDALLESDQMESTARYLTSGRRFASLETEEIKKRWTQAARTFLISYGGINPRDVDDLGSELGLRKVALPCEEVSAEAAAVARRIGRDDDPEGHARIRDRISTPYVAKVSRAGIESLRPINLMLSRAQLAL